MVTLSMDSSESRVMTGKMLSLEGEKAFANAQSIKSVLEEFK